MPKLTKAWACERCGHVYRHDSLGKAFAKECCMCECGQPGLMIGDPSRCGDCRDKRTIEDAEWDVEKSTARLKQLRANIKLKKRKT